MVQHGSARHVTALTTAVCLYAHQVLASSSLQSGTAWVTSLRRTSQQQPCYLSLSLGCMCCCAGLVALGPAAGLCSHPKVCAPQAHPASQPGAAAELGAVPGRHGCAQPVGRWHKVLLGRIAHCLRLHEWFDGFPLWFDGTVCLFVVVVTWSFPCTFVTAERQRACLTPGMLLSNRSHAWLSLCCSTADGGTANLAAASHSLHLQAPLTPRPNTTNRQRGAK